MINAKANTQTAQQLANSYNRNFIIWTNSRGQVNIQPESEKMLQPFTNLELTVNLEMRKPDLTYTDILAKDIDLYVNQPDEECHKLEASIGSWAEQRFNILVWLKEEN